MRTARTDRATRVLGALTLTLALALSATACGQDEGSEAKRQVSATEHNDADVAFASDMLQHHAQALSMVDLSLDRTLDPAVRQLAEQVRDAQAPEIETFTDWLVEWDEEVPETMRDHANAGHDQGEVSDSMEGIDSDMPGMMSSADMQALQDAPDAEFQTRWLEMMTEHHEGAVEMAKTETQDGRYEPAVDLAEEIISSQSAQVDTMTSLSG